MVNDGSKARVSAAPPHELNVRKYVESRASELEGLYSIVSDRMNNDFRSRRNKRKRTTGHDNRVTKKRFRKRGKVEIVDDSSLRKDEKKISRRVRRSIEFKKNSPSGFGTSGDGTKRLRTHVWHAKRFTMTKLWGFHIPLGLHGRGRGSRVLLKKLRSGVLVHDASYYVAVQLEGPQDKLVSILCSVLVPSPTAHSEAISREILAGSVYASAMLHHAGNPCFPPIAPVTYMWRPLPQLATNKEEQQSVDEEIPFRQLWVWIHAAAFEEAYDVLRSACGKQMDMTGGSAQCISLEGQIAKLELVGSRASQILQNTLFPVCCMSENSRHLKKCSANEHDDHGEAEKTCIVQNSWHMKECTANEHDDPGKAEKTCILKNFSQSSVSSIVPFTVIDPRLFTKNENDNVPERNPLGLLNYGELETEEHTVSPLLKNETKCAVGDRDLWDASKRLCPPFEESIVCMEKYNQRKDFVRLGPKIQTALVEGNYSRYCPILLLKDGNHEDSVIRCSIILPLSWVKVFWLNLISNGAHAIGSREKRWVACEIGLPCFPFDFPDCNAYSRIKATEASDSDQKTRLLPPSKRPLEIPIPSPWNSLQRNVAKVSIEVGNPHDLVGDHVSDDEKVDNLVKNLVSATSETKMFDCLDDPFEGFVARTSRVLSDFISTISIKNLLLFPRIPDQNICMYKFMKDEEFDKQDAVIPVKNSGRCFVRVLLHAFKEGVFEEGAVVCAPRVADIKLWTRPENDSQQLQISESSLRSCFVRHPSGKWELQIPEDHSAQESYRWPIGFVTTGFVRGSKKATAGALCEAIALSRIRMEQWKSFPVRQRKKFYVLVRNMRSTAYRLALATIVLEQVEEDVKFL